MKRVYQWLGGIVWLAALSALLGLLISDNKGALSGAARVLLARPQTVSLASTTSSIPVDAPVVLKPDSGPWQLAGSVHAVRPADGGADVEIEWIAAEPPQQFEFQMRYSSNRLDDTVAMLIPAETRDLIRQRLEEFHRMHGRRLLRRLEPVIQETIVDSLPVIEDAVAASLRRNSEAVDALADRYRQTLLKERFVPLVREEVLPTVRVHAEPLVTEIGRELWNRASLWRFGWRALYDRSPLPDKDLAAQEWDRFVEEEVTPILEAHADEFVEIQRQIISDLARNSRIRESLRETAQDLVHDQELQQLVATVLRDALVKNPQLQQIWEDAWHSPEVQAVLSDTGDQMEPLIREIGDEIFGSREKGINPQFARVLRSQILGKDRIWIEARPVNAELKRSGPLRLKPPASLSHYPLIVTTEADRE